jgi:hypothetical protein
MGMADITVICYNCLEEKSRNVYNRSYQSQSLVDLIKQKSSWTQNTRRVSCEWRRVSATSLTCHCNQPIKLTRAPVFRSALTHSRPMPVAAPVTRAVFPLMNMSHFLKHGGKFKHNCLGRKTLKVVHVNLLPTYCSASFQVYPYVFQPLHISNSRKQLKYNTVIG